MFKIVIQVGIENHSAQGLVKENYALQPRPEETSMTLPKDKSMACHLFHITLSATWFPFRNLASLSKILSLKLSFLVLFFTILVHPHRVDSPSQFLNKCAKGIPYNRDVSRFKHIPNEAYFLR